MRQLSSAFEQMSKNINVLELTCFYCCWSPAANVTRVCVVYLDIHYQHHRTYFHVSHQELIFPIKIIRGQLPSARFPCCFVSLEVFLRDPKRSGWGLEGCAFIFRFDFFFTSLTAVLNCGVPQSAVLSRCLISVWCPFRIFLKSTCSFHHNKHNPDNSDEKGSF